MSTTHDTADCAGANGLVPDNGDRTESIPAADTAVTAATSGAASGTKSTKGATLAAAVTGCATTDSTETAAGIETIGGSRESVPTEGCGDAWEVAVDRVARAELLAGVEAGAAMGAATFRAAEGPEAVVPPAEPEGAVTERSARVRTDERGAAEVPVAVPVAPSLLDGDVASVASAHAVAASPKASPTPIPRAIAKPPTRPT